MRKMMLDPIGILVACSVVYTAGSAENPATAPAAPAAAAPAAPAAAAPAAPAAAAPAAAAPAATPAAAPAATPAAPAAAAPAAASATLSGKWSSNFVGEVTLEQTGNKIVGVYQYKDDDGVTQDGKIEGLVKDKMIQAKWWERPKVGKGEESRGELEWKIADDGKMLIGWYSEEGEKEKQDLNLTR